MLLTTSQSSLATTTRLPRLTRSESASAAEWLILLGVGAVAAMLTAYVNLSLRMPGSAVIRAVVPMVLGMALVPRRGAGAVMSLGAMCIALPLRLTGHTEMPTAALLGLLLVGPMLDWLAAGARSGWNLYLRCASAGIAMNLVIYFFRWGAAWLAGESLAGKNFGRLGLGALASFVLCGAIAGLIGAILAFRPTADTSSSTQA